jgi:hypothetical protein
MTVNGRLFTSTVCPPLPERMADHYDRLRIRGNVFIGGEKAAERGPRAENLEVVAGDEIRLSEQPFTAGADRKREHVPGGDAAHAFRLARQVLIVGVRYRGRADAVAMHPVDDHQLVGSRDTRNRAQHDGVGDAHDRAHRADADRDDGDRDEGEQRLLSQNPAGVARIL